MKKRIRVVVAIIIVLATIYGFIDYILDHHKIIIRFLKINPLEILLIILLYGFIFCVLFLLLKYSVKFFNIDIPKKDNLLINSYSLLANFSFFGQAGPGLRALYLKKKYKLAIKKFIFITLIYYAFYSLIAIGLILFGSQLKVIYDVLILILGILINFLILRWFLYRQHLEAEKRLLSIRYLVYIFLITLAQLLIHTIIYGVELESIGNFSWHQIIAYSGFADLSLFASITPGGIGVKEAFLIFSERIHHISTSSIVLASLIDRSSYFIYLLIMLIIVLLFHGFKKIKDMSLKDKNVIENK